MKERIVNKILATNFIEESIKNIKNKIGDKKVLLALSGGVDSSVVAILLHKAIGKNLICIHINHGLLRHNESEEIINFFKHNLHINLIYINAVKYFLNKLKKICNPEKKRKIIGKCFIDVFYKKAKKLKIYYLAQGTIYPDISESKNLKSHHNVGGLPENIKNKFKLVEPLKELFKDEVRIIGLTLGLPKNIIYRQPFPGPGLGVRCLENIDLKRLQILRESDKILREEFKKNNLDQKVWQYFTIISKTKSTGIKNNKRVFGYTIIIRAVNSIDALNATIEEIPYNILKEITNRFLNELKNVNRVVYDITPKPIGTIEWE